VFCRPCLAILKEKSFIDVPPSTKLNFGTLFLLSFLPGINFMYLGLIKRGLATLTGFFLIIYLLTLGLVRPLPLFLGLSIPVYILASMFVGFGVRRRICSGEVVHDDVSRMLSSLFKSKVFLVILILLGAATVVFTIVGFAFSLLRQLLPIVILIVGVYLIVRHRNRKE